MMFNFLRILAGAYLPAASTREEEEWNAKEHNKALAGLFPHDNIKRIRTADILSRQRYDEMDSDIRTMKDARAGLKSFPE